MRARIAHLLRRITRRPEPKPDVLAWVEDVAGIKLTPEQAGFLACYYAQPPTWITLDEGARRLISPRDDVAEFRRRWLDDMYRIQDKINQMHQRREEIERTCGFDGR